MENLINYIKSRITLTQNEIDLIKKLLKEKDAKIIAHYYTHEDVQEVAEITGGNVSDSLEMAKFGASQSSKMLIVAGVRFMGETAKILNPEKKILMPQHFCWVNSGGFYCRIKRG